MSDFILPEVITEILKRLPVESLLRFRCVCRDWYSLISSPNFISQQLSQSSSASLSTPTLVRRYSKLHSKEIYTLFHDESFDLDNSTRISFPFHGKCKFYFRIVGVCNGLLCLSDDMFGYKETIIVWNPSIKRAITLPTPRVVFDRSGPYSFALGFGFDSITNDYKVVRVAYLLPDNKRRHVLPPEVEVLSLSSNVWRHVKNSVEAYICEDFWSQAVVGGAVHWVAYKPPCKDEKDGSFHNLILKFDLNSETFVEMGLPKVLVRRPPVAISVTVIKGLFAVVYNDEFMHPTDLSKGRCLVWVMKDNGSWTKVVNVRLGAGLSRMLGVKRDGEYLFSGESGGLVFYNPENKNVTFTEISGTKDSFYVDKFTESLVLLGKGEKVEKSEPDYENVDERVEKSEYQHKVISFSLISSTLVPYDD